VDESVLLRSTIVLPVQINGKRRGEIVVPIDASEDQVRHIVEEEPTLRRWILDAKIKKLILVPGRIVNVLI